jgi:hypothetical protein
MTLIRAGGVPGGESVGSVIRELHIDSEVLLPQHGYDVLQRIAVLAAHAHQIALDRGLHFLF